MKTTLTGLSYIHIQLCMVYEDCDVIAVVAFMYTVFEVKASLQHAVVVA